MKNRNLIWVGALAFIFPLSASAGTVTMYSSSSGPQSSDGSEIVINRDEILTVEVESSNGTVTASPSPGSGVTIVSDDGSGTQDEVFTFAFNSSTEGQQVTIGIDETHTGSSGEFCSTKTINLKVDVIQLTSDNNLAYTGGGAGTLFVSGGDAIMSSALITASGSATIEPPQASAILQVTPALSLRIDQNANALRKQYYQGSTSSGQELTSSNNYIQDGPPGESNTSILAGSIYATLSDSPDFGASYATYGKLTTGDQFQDYLQYKLNGEDWHSVQVANWAWSGIAAGNTAGAWSGSNSSVAVGGPSATTQDPTYSPTIQSLTLQSF